MNTGTGESRLHRLTFRALAFQRPATSVGAPVARRDGRAGWINSNTPLEDHLLAACREPSALEGWIFEIL